MKLQNSYSIQEFKGQKQENTKPKKVNGFIPQCAAVITAAITMGLHEEYSSSVITNLRKYSDLSDDTVKMVHSAAREVLKEEGLDKYGITIKLLPKLKKTPTLLTLMKNPILQVNAGLNSMFLGTNFKTVNELGEEIHYKGNTVFLPEKTSCLTAFHEIGHAANYNKSKLTKLLLELNAHCQKLALLPIIYGVLTRKAKPDEDGNLTKGQKVKNFIRDNAGKITIACLVPTLIEEGLASIRAQSYAKKHLPPDLIKKVTKTNLLAYSTYVGLAISGAIAAKLGISVKDKMIANKEAKVAKKLESQKA